MLAITHKTEASEIIVVIMQFVSSIKINFPQQLHVLSGYNIDTHCVP